MKNHKLSLALLLIAAGNVSFIHVFANERTLAPCDSWCNPVSQSMYPTVKGGERIRIVPIAWEDIRCGKDGTFLSVWRPFERQNIAHRVVRKFVWHGRRYVVTKGDANAKEDDFRTPEELINGEVVIVAAK